MKSGGSDYFKIKTQRFLKEPCIILILHWVFSVMLGFVILKGNSFARVYDSAYPQSVLFCL